MKKISTLFALSIAAMLSAQQTQRVLFLGNSYTAVNNLPQLVHDIALANGDTLIFDSNTPGGYTFQLHSTDATSVSKINAQPWDAVVLQGQSQEPSFDSAYVVQNVFPYAARLDSMIRANDSCTQTVFYMTWGRKNGDASNCAAYPPVCTYLGMQGELRRRYLQMAYDNDAVVAPCGPAWREVIATNPVFDLYMADESHPSLYGSYLNACVFYATLFHRSPAGINFYSTLPQNEAVLLQNAADAIVFDSLNVWNTYADHPQPSFTMSGSGLGVTFTSTSLDASSVSWFENANPMGTGNIITYNFSSPGTYPVTMIASNSCYTDTLRDTITVPLTTAIAENASDFFFRVSPNPSGGKIMLRCNAVSEVRWILRDASGRNIESGKWNGDQAAIEIHAGSGLYFLECSVNGKRSVQKLVIE